MNRFLLSMLMIGLYFPVWAQNSTGGEIEMADALRSSGKIYVVVTVLVIIMAGIFIYLLGLDRKMKKFEKEIKDRNS